MAELKEKFKDKGEFEKEFDVQTNNGVAYKDFIVSLRRQLGQMGKKSSRDCPVLPIEKDVKSTRWFDIVLRIKDHSIRLRIKLSNLYLIGYQMENKQWLEFGKSNPHLIPGSNFLGFGGDYKSLLQRTFQKPIDDPLTDPSHMMEKIKLGKETLVHAVNQLATATDDKNRARSLIIVILMICESIRFIPVSDHLTSKFRDGTPIDPWIIKLIHAWEDLSKQLLLADAHPEQSFGLTNTLLIPSGKISTLADAAKELGILLGFKNLEK